LVTAAGQRMQCKDQRRITHYSASTMWLSSTASNFSGTMPLKSTNDNVILNVSYKDYLIDEPHVHVDPAVCKTGRMGVVSVSLETDPGHDLMRRPAEGVI
jgi:hypothetical protein